MFYMIEIIHQWLGIGDGVCTYTLKAGATFGGLWITRCKFWADRFHVKLISVECLTHDRNSPSLHIQVDKSKSRLSYLLLPSLSIPPAVVCFDHGKQKTIMVASLGTLAPQALSHTCRWSMRGIKHLVGKVGIRTLHVPMWGYLIGG